MMELTERKINNLRAVARIIYKRKYGIDIEFTKSVEEVIKDNKAGAVKNNANNSS